jgi:hypothetical protein
LKTILWWHRNRNKDKQGTIRRLIFITKDVEVSGDIENIRGFINKKGDWK